VARRSEARLLARIDPEGFFDFQQQRPLVQISDEGEREIVWPWNDFIGISSDGPRDLVVCAGYEPHLRWRTFASYVVEIVRRCDAEMVVTLGAMVGLVPHTRPVAGARPILRCRRSRLGVCPTGPTGWSAPPICSTMNVPSSLRGRAALRRTRIPCDGQLLQRSNRSRAPTRYASSSRRPWRTSDGRR
jgi:hypothetical protein